MIESGYKRFEASDKLKMENSCDGTYRDWVEPTLLLAPCSKSFLNLIPSVLISLTCCCWGF